MRKGTLQIMDKDSLSGFNSTTHTYGGGQILHRVLGASDSDSITEAAYNALKTKEEKTSTRAARYSFPAARRCGGQGDDGRRRQRRRPLAQGVEHVPATGQPGQRTGGGLHPRRRHQDTEKVATEPDGTRWWEVDVGKIDGSSAVGWAREKDHAKVTRCSPWEWPGFEFIEADGTTPEALYARHVVATKQAKPDEQAALEAKAAQANGGPLFSRVCDAIDLDDDRHLTPQNCARP